MVASHSIAGLAFLLGMWIPLGLCQSAAASPALTAAERRVEWLRTDFTKHTIELSEIRSGGPPKDGIPAIDDQQFRSVGEFPDLTARELDIQLSVQNEARAYRLRLLTWHTSVTKPVEKVGIRTCRS